MFESPQSIPGFTHRPMRSFLHTFLALPLISGVVKHFKNILIRVLRAGPVPRHVALIMDGNRTYARSKNLALKDGHTAGAESLSKVLDLSYKLGIEQVTVFAFSIENFNRPQEEVDTLFGLLRDQLKVLSENESSYARFNEIKIKIIGNRALIPADILTDLEVVESRTCNNDSKSKRVLNVCFPYTSRDDIAFAIQSIASQVQQHQIESSSISLQTLTDNMYLGPETPPLDILIRTSGHTRLSDFMMWQCSTECFIVFVNTLWPEFTFLPMLKVLVEWSFYKTLSIEHESRVKQNPVFTINSVYPSLPAPPPFASIS